MYVCVSAVCLHWMSIYGSEKAREREREAKLIWGPEGQPLPMNNVK